MSQCSQLVKIANGDNMHIKGYGNICLNDKLILKHVLFVPDIDCNLISVKRLMSDNCCWTIFTSSKCYFLPISSSWIQEDIMRQRATNEMIGSANHHKGLFFLENAESECFGGYPNVYSCMNKRTVPRIDTYDS